MDMLEHSNPWFIVDIPENTARVKSLQRIMTLSEKSKHNAKIFVHYEEGRVLFKILDSCSTLNDSEVIELNNDPDAHDDFILQYGRQILVCKSTEHVFGSCFSKGMNRGIQYKNLPEIEVTRSESVYNVCLPHKVTTYKKDEENCVSKLSVADNKCNSMISLKTGKRLPDNPEDPMLEVKNKRIKIEDNPEDLVLEVKNKKIKIEDNPEDPVLDGSQVRNKKIKNEDNPEDPMLESKNKKIKIEDNPEDLMLEVRNNNIKVEDNPVNPVFEVRNKKIKTVNPVFEVRNKKIKMVNPAFEVRKKKINFEDNPEDPVLEVRNKKIKIGDSRRCAPARNRKDIKQISSVYIKGVGKASDEGTATTNTSAVTEELIKEDTKVLNEAKSTDKTAATNFSLDSDALDEARSYNVKKNEDKRATQIRFTLAKEMKKYFRRYTFLVACNQRKNLPSKKNIPDEKESKLKETAKEGFITRENKKSISYQEDDVHKNTESGKYRRQKKTSTSNNAPKGRKMSRSYFEKVLNKVKLYAAKRSDDQEILKRRQKKPFRNKGWSKNSVENLKPKYIFDEIALSILSLEESSDKYSKAIIKLLREITDLLHHERSWKVTGHVYPSRRGKFSKASQRQRQQGRTHSSQAAEGIQDQHPTQVSDATSENLSLPPAELLATSARSIFNTSTSHSQAPTTNLMVSIDAERSLVNRIRGVLPANRFSRPQQPPKHQQYSDQPSRQRSFGNWPASSGQDASRMAVYGFFYTGRFDLVRCFQCGIGLKDWAAPDEPLFEHIKHSPDCQFLKDLLGQDLLNAYRDNLLANQLRQATATSGSTAGNQTQPAGRIRNPQYSEAEARLRSFNKWPANSLQRPQVLVDAGLFYTGFNDLCRCFTCDGGLQRWDADDDPWIEHARWFPHCTYVRQIKGQDYINMVQQAAAQAREEEQDPAVVYPAPGQRRGRGPVEQGISDLTLEDTNPLNTPAAQSVVGMGYSRRAVLLAIHEFNGQAHGESNSYQAGDLVRILTERQDRGEALPPDSPRDNYATPASALIPENMDPEEENRRLRGILKCMQCEENDTNILFLPCTHHRMCEDCAENALICPVCGRKIDEKIKTFMS